MSQRNVELAKKSAEAQESGDIDAAFAFRVTGVGPGSGAELELPIAFVERFSDDQILRVEEYVNPADALEAVGLKA